MELSNQISVSFHKKFPHLIIRNSNDSCDHTRHGTLHSTNFKHTVWWSGQHSLLNSFEAWPVGHTMVQRSAGMG